MLWLWVVLRVEPIVCLVNLPDEALNGLLVCNALDHCILFFPLIVDIITCTDGVRVLPGMIQLADTMHEEYYILFVSSSCL